MPINYTRRLINLPNDEQQVPDAYTEYFHLLKQIKRAESKATGLE
jgi:hypothetical protein